MTHVIKRKSKEKACYCGGFHKIKKWDNANKMHFDSEHKTFNRQTNLITTGNAIMNTQTSFFVRPYNEAKNPVGEKVEKGAMQDYDLGQFTNLPSEVRDFVKGFAKTKSVILYDFHYYGKGDRRVTVGYVVTDGNHRLVKKWSYGGYKADSVIDEASKYVSC